jgi:ribosomal protein S18 acetylase RimI-like enzyme
MKIESAIPLDIPRLCEFLLDLFSLEPDFSSDTPTILQGLKKFMGVENIGSPSRLNSISKSRSVSNNGRTILVLRDKSGIPQGMISGQLVISTAMGSPSLWIEDVYVAPEHRGRGWGSRLLQSIIHWGSQRGARRFQLLADQNNHRAIEFYHSQKFKTAGLMVLSIKN